MKDNDLIPTFGDAMTQRWNALFAAWDEDATTPVDGRRRFTFPIQHNETDAAAHRTPTPVG